MSNPIPGTSFLVSATSAGDEGTPSIAALANGQFVAVWHDSSDNVVGRIYHADGTPATGQFPINTSLQFSQFYPVVAGFADGRFVVAWSDGGANAEVTARIFNADGTPASGQIAVATAGNAAHCAIATLDGGGFVVTWEHNFGQGDYDIHARAFDANGVALGSSFVVDGNSAFEYGVAVTGLPGGNYVIAWYDLAPADGSGSHIRAQMFSGNGAAPIDAPAGEFIVNTTAAGDQTWPAIAALADGRFMVTWNSAGGEIRGRVFGSDGTPLSDDYQVASGAGVHESAVTALNDGRFFITYTQSSNGVDQVYGVARDADATVDGGADAIPILGTGANQSAVATVVDGRVIVLATGLAPANPNNPADVAIMARWIEPRQAGIQLNGKQLGDEWVGTDFADTMAGGGGNDHLVGIGGLDNLTGGDGDDTLEGGGSGSVLEGGPGADYLSGGSSVAATYASSDAAVFISLQAGTASGGHATGDTLDVSDLIGSGFADALAGNADPNRLAGGGGNDTLKGGGGMDALTGGTGDDTLFGGADYDTAVFAGTRADYLFTALESGAIQVTDQRPGAPDGTDMLSGVEDASFVSEGTFYHMSRLVGFAPLGDVLWQHTDRSLAIAGHDFGFLSFGHQIVGTGDFDHDGDSDILRRNDVGGVMVLELENQEIVEAHDLGPVASTWQVGGSGDFDADGDDDILFRHDGGDTVTWEMQDGLYVVNHNLGSVATTWQIAGTGDFDHDGDDDILWRHQDGQVVTWEMENGAYVVNHNLGDVPTTWQIRGVGDFDADGDADILWHHQDGQIVTWEMEAGAYVVNHNQPSVATSWHIEGVHDFDHDGDADILFRHVGGQVVTWEMQNGSYVQNHNHGLVWNAWQIVGTGEFDLA